MGRNKWGTNMEREEKRRGILLQTQQKFTASGNQLAFGELNIENEIVSDATKSSRAQDIKTGCVGLVGYTRRTVRHLMLAAWYALTARWPRQLPDTEEKILELKNTLIKFYGLEDRPDVWLTVCGQMASQPIYTSRISYKRLATAGHRLKTNAVIKTHKDIEIGKLQARIEEIAKQMADNEPRTEPAVSSETHDLQGDVQALPGTTHPVVSNSRDEDGLY